MNARLLFLAGLLAAAPVAAAQDAAARASSGTDDARLQMDHSQMDHSQMDHSQMDHSQMDHSQMDHSQMDHSQMDHSQMDHSQMDHSQMDHSQMDHSQMDHSQMDHSQASSADVPRTPVPVPTAADIAAAFPTLQTGHVHGPAPVHYLLVDRLEGWDREAGSGQAWEVNGWYGGDLHRLRLRSEGERSAGRTHEADLELLYGRAISPWWEVVAGLRQDFKPGAARTRPAFGVLGMAPYKFEVSATAYVGGDSTAALRLEGEYTLLLSRRWILQPRLEANLSASEDRARGDGGGLDSVSAGLRLRYEVSRRFAPYVGWEHERRFGDATDFARQDGEPGRESRFVAGLRFWF